MYTYNSIPEALNDLKQGKMIVITDDESRENEGDIVMAAEFATTETINFMACFAKGLICMPMDEATTKKLGLSPMTRENTDPHATAFTESIDHIDTGTGISAAERALTAQKVVGADAKPSDFQRPGHMFPLVAKEQGVLVRPGHTEATVDLMRLSGLSPVGICCEIMDDDGLMMKTPKLMEFAKTHDLKFITIEALIKYRLAHDYPVTKKASTKFPTRFGNFTLHAYYDELAKTEHLALTLGDISTSPPVLARVHSECLTGDALGSLRCDCGNQYDAAMEKIAAEGRGVLIYLRQEGRGIGLLNKIKAYELQDTGLDTIEANLALGFPEDMRSYAVAANMLKDLSIHKVKLMSNNPDKTRQLESYGITVSEHVPIQTSACADNMFYLKTKQEKMGHDLHL